MACSSSLWITSIIKWARRSSPTQIDLKFTPPLLISRSRAFSSNLSPSRNLLWFIAVASSVPLGMTTRVTSELATFKRLRTTSLVRFSSFSLHIFLLISPVDRFQPQLLSFIESSVNLASKFPSLPLIGRRAVLLETLAVFVCKKYGFKNADIAIFSLPIVLQACSTLYLPLNSITIF